VLRQVRPPGACQLKTRELGPRWREALRLITRPCPGLARRRAGLQEGGVAGGRARRRAGLQESVASGPVGDLHFALQPRPVHQSTSPCLHPPPPWTELQERTVQ
jgi:hypothetical protein